MDEHSIDNEKIEERKKKVIDFLRRKYDWFSYVILAVIVWLAVYIRTRNLPLLKDITTGTWTLGPDLDPFLFLRWAQYIVENGSLMAIDTMRYVPLGFDTRAELIFLSYLIAWFHKVTFALGITESITHSAVLFPVFMFALTVAAFFILVRKIFIGDLGTMKANAVALVSSLFLSIIPALLPRTIAGIPEKESAAFFFMFLSLYFFICAWKSEKKYGKYLLALLAGLSTAGMALIWGGFIYITLTIAISLLMALILYQTDKNKLYVSLIWLISSLSLMHIFSTRYAIQSIAGSTIIGISEFAIISMLIYLFLLSAKIKPHLENNRTLSMIPLPFLSMAIAVVFASLAGVILFGPEFFMEKIGDLTKPLITPISDRLGVTVAENRQPYFGEWAGSFGPTIKGVPVFFWLFLIGSVYLYYNLISAFSKKERTIMTGGYFVFLIAIIYSRYSPTSLLNGTNAASILFYLFGVASLVLSFGYFYYKEFRKNNTEILKNIDFGRMVLFSLFFFSIISARGGVRVIMVLVPPASVMAGYFVVGLFAKARKTDSKNYKKISWGIVAIVIISLMFSGYRFYLESKYTAESYAPSIYTQQWQKSMSWVRENTQENAVFAHWWDYGYWVQSLGERATMLDGGNAIGYWNHFMGRYGLTGSNSLRAAEMLYAHNVTHFLIDSTDIGKYTAFSSIGSDVNYDRRSWISTFLRDDSQIYETKNATTYFYRGGFSLDEDIAYEENGTKIFLPGLGKGSTERTVNTAGLGAITINVGKGNVSNISQPIGIFVYQNKQHSLPIRYAFYNKKLIDFGTGVDAGVFIFPRADQSGNQISIVKDGALLYLSGRTVHSQLARLYLYGEEDEFFKVANVQDDIFVESLKSQGAAVGNFVLFGGGFRGPIKIWEINYPEDIEFKEEFLNTVWPEELMRA